MNRLQGMAEDLARYDTLPDPAWRDQMQRVVLIEVDHLLGTLRAEIAAPYENRMPEPAPVRRHRLPWRHKR